MQSFLTLALYDEKAQVIFLGGFFYLIILV